MNTTLCCKQRNLYSIRMYLILLSVISIPIWAADEITGDWDIHMDFGGRQSLASLSIAQKSDGTLRGWWGAGEVADIRFDNSMLTFVRTVRWGDKGFTLNYQGTLRDGRLIGMLFNDRGEFSANGVRPQPKSPVLGQWRVAMGPGDQALLTVSEKLDGTLHGMWTQQGRELPLAEVTYENSRLTFVYEASRGDHKRVSTFAGTISGHILKGQFVYRADEGPVRAKRIGADLIGKWLLTSSSDWGTRTRLLTVYGDLTGRYESFGGELPIDAIEVDGDQISVHIEMSFGDRTFVTDYQATLKTGQLEGELTTSKGMRTLTGKRMISE
jgi:hypothetical protein